MNKTYDDFVKFVSVPGAKSTIRIDWMAKGCPKCKGRKWAVTNDGWAYCMSCNKGYLTYGVYTNQVLEVMDFTLNESEE